MWAPGTELTLLVLLGISPAEPSHRPCCLSELSSTKASGLIVMASDAPCSQNLLDFNDDEEEEEVLCEKDVGCDDGVFGI